MHFPTCMSLFGDQIAIGTKERRLLVYSYVDGVLRGHSRVHFDALSSLAVSKCGTMCLTGSRNEIALYHLPQKGQKEKQAKKGKAKAK